MGDQDALQRREFQVNTGDDMSRGRYTNSMLVTHSQEEFIIDWLLNSPSGVHLVSRIVLTPGHAKRVIAALSDNMTRYEAAFGPVGLTEAKDQKFL